MRERSDADTGEHTRQKGWMEAEYDRQQRLRRKKSGNCILEVKVRMCSPVVMLLQ